jgi:hypothetical protein
MALSPNYNWSEPDNSSLVKDGAQAMRTLGNAIDTSLWNSGYGQAGKNKFINGDFSVNQRSFTSVTANSTYTFDRWRTDFSGGTVTFTPQVFTPAAAPVAGYESSNFLRIVTSGQTGSNYAGILQPIENVRTFAGQTITVSFWAKAGSGTPKINAVVSQRFGTGGSSTVTTYSTDQTISTSWARYSFNVTVPSMSGKTIGTDSSCWIYALVSDGTTALGIQNNTFDLWGFQAEYGTRSTPFQTASGGSIQGELAMCQRYYWRSSGTAVYQNHVLGYARNTTDCDFSISLPVAMRVPPTAIQFSAQCAHTPTIYATAFTSVILGDGSTTTTGSLVGLGGAGLVQYRPYFLANQNNPAGYIAFIAEL